MTKEAVNQNRALDVGADNMNVTARRTGKTVPGRTRIAATATTQDTPSATLDNASNAGMTVGTVPLSPRSRRTKEDPRAHEAVAALPDGSAGESDDGLSNLRTLIKLGKERGFVIRREISDCLPDHLAQLDAIESVVRSFTDMGITVFEQAPDGKVPLLPENKAIEKSLWWTAVRGAHLPEPVPIDIAAQSTT
jgi:RNA polymerase primary sigma factor